MSHQYVTAEFPTARPTEKRAGYVYLIKRSDGAIKVGISSNVRRRRSQLATSSPEQLSILKIIRPGKGLAFQIEGAVKLLLRPFRRRGEWFNCSDALALLALRAAEYGELDCRALIAAELERLWLVDHGEQKAWEAHIAEMSRRWPVHMHEVDPWGCALLGNSSDNSKGGGAGHAT